MDKSNTIVSLTTDLLANGAFSHLYDNEITNLDHLLMRLTDPPTILYQDQLLNFWYRADIAEIPAVLVYQCNSLLQQFGRVPMEEFVIDDIIM